MDDLFRTYLGSKSAGLISEIKKLSPSLAADLKRISANAIDEIGELAKFAYQSKIPVDTAELRNSFIIKSSPSRSSNQPQSTVYVFKGTHYGRDRKPIDSQKLADLLNIGDGPKGDLRRSHNSAAIGSIPVVKSFGSEGKGTPTRDWIAKADRALNGKIQSYLNQKDFNY